MLHIVVYNHSTCNFERRACNTHSAHVRTMHTLARSFKLWCTSPQPSYGHVSLSKISRHDWLHHPISHVTSHIHAVHGYPILSIQLQVERKATLYPATSKATTWPLDKAKGNNGSLLLLAKGASLARSEKFPSLKLTLLGSSSFTKAHILHDIVYIPAIKS
jgi:hypothetical protein